MKPIYYINASLMKGSGACRRKSFWTSVLGMTGRVPNNDTLFGTAVHAFRAEFINSGGNYRLALPAAVDLYRNTPKQMKPNKLWMTEARLASVCMLYGEVVLRRRAFETFDHPTKPGKKLTEQTFSIPLLNHDRFEIHVSGTIDDLGKFSYGAYGICDLKTTSSWETEDFLAAYEMTVQLKLYVWAIKYMARLGMVKENSIIGQLAQKPLVAFIDGVFLKENSDPVFKESDKFEFSNKELEDLEDMLFEFANTLANEIENWMDCEVEPMPTGIIYDSCSTKYGLCQFFNVCNAPTVEFFRIMKDSFVRKPYNPLMFRTQELENMKVKE